MVRSSGLLQAARLEREQIVEADSKIAGEQHFVLGYKYCPSVERLNQ